MKSPTCAVCVSVAVVFSRLFKHPSFIGCFYSVNKFILFCCPSDNRTRENWSSWEINLAFIMWQCVKLIKSCWCSVLEYAMHLTVVQAYDWLLHVERLFTTIIHRELDVIRITVLQTLLSQLLYSSISLHFDYSTNVILCRKTLFFLSYFQCILFICSADDILQESPFALLYRIVCYVWPFKIFSNKDYSLYHLTMLSN